MNLEVLRGREEEGLPFKRGAALPKDTDVGNERMRTELEV